jgi:predicted nucleic acid-binding protein
LTQVLEFVEQIRLQPACVIIEPGARHWEIFADLCRRAGARGNHVLDAYLGTLAIEKETSG